MTITDTSFSPTPVQLQKQTRASSVGFEGKGLLVVEDHLELINLIQKVRSKVRANHFRSWLDTAIALATSFAAGHVGTAPSFFPVFSHSGFAGGGLPSKILLKQDKLTAEQISNFFGLFLYLPPKSIPKVYFEYYDRKSCLDLLSKVASLIKPFEVFGKQKTDIVLAHQPPSAEETISFVLDGNYSPSFNVDLSADEDFGHAWAVARNSKLYDAPPAAQSKIDNAIHKLLILYSQAPISEHHFWISLIIQMQLDLAYIKDQAPKEAMIALAFARALDSNEMIAHCERFANQILGVSGEALAMLEDSCRRFDSIPENSETFLQFAHSKFGAKQNRNTTSLIALKEKPIPEKFEADYCEAKSILPHYSNMAMLGNAAAMAYLCVDEPKKSIAIFEDTLLQNALPVDRINLQVNLLAAQFIESGCLDEKLFEDTCDEIDKLELGESWEYQRARMTVNLLRIAPSKHLREKIWNAGKNSSFWNGLSDNTNLDALMETLMRKRYQHYFENHKIPGVFGVFSEKHKLSLCIDKDWT